MTKYKQQNIHSLDTLAISRAHFTISQMVKTNWYACSEFEAFQDPGAPGQLPTFPVRYAESINWCA